MTITDDAQRLLAIESMNPTQTNASELPVTDVQPPADEPTLDFRQRFRQRIALAVLFLLSFALPAQAGQLSPGPQICPFFGNFLTPTLLDVLFYPGLTFRQ